MVRACELSTMTEEVSGEAGFVTFARSVLPDFLSSVGVRVVEHSAGKSVITWKLDHVADQDVLIEITALSNGKIRALVKVDPAAKPDARVRKALCFVRSALSGIFWELSLYSEEDIKESAGAATPSQLNMVNRLVRRFGKRGDELSLVKEGAIIVRYGSSVFTIKPDGNYSQS